MDYKSIVEEKRARLEKIRKQRAENEKRLPSGSVIPEVLTSRKNDPKEQNTSTANRNDEKIEKILKQLVPDNKSVERQQPNKLFNIEDEKENVNSNLQPVPNNQTQLSNNPNSKVNIPEMSQIETTFQAPDSWYLEEELASREHEIRKEVKKSLEAELRQKIENELKAKYEKLLLEAQQEQKVNEQVENELGYDSKLQEFEENLEKDSEYAQPDNSDEYSSSSMTLLSLPNVFSDYELIEDRSILYIDNSPFFPELVLVSYSSPNDGSDKPHGLVVVWNTLKKKKEFIFLAQAVILIAQFSKIKSNQIYGCGDNGILYLWDFSSISRYPVVQTQPDYKSENQHFQPIVELYQTHSTNTHNEKTGNLNASMLTTISSDGLICFWSPDLISKSLKSSLKVKLPTEHAYLEITSMAVLPSDPGYLLVGTSFGYIYRVHLFDNMDHKIGVDTDNIFFGHTQAPVMSISPISSTSTVTNYNVINGLFLTSGSDFSIRIHKLDTTSSKKFNNPSFRDADYLHGGLSEENLYTHPLLVLNTENFTMDAQWRPNHISQFASVDSVGFIQLWDLCKNNVGPIDSLDLSEIIKKLAKIKRHGGATEESDDDEAHEEAEEGDTTADITVDETVDELGLNRIRWSSDGSTLLVGGMNGQLYSFTCTGDFKKPDTNSIYLQFKTVLKT